MSDFEKGREGRPKRYFSVSKEKREYGPGIRRSPIILANPDRDSVPEKNKQPTQQQHQTTIILRNREGSSFPTQRPSSSNAVRKETEIQPLYQLAAKHAPGENISNTLSQPPEMRGSVKLLDDNLQVLQDAILEYLLDQGNNEFLVVGVVGSLGVGKSTLMSLLAGGQSKPFAPQRVQQQELGGQGTLGVDVFVTPDRLILLDTQPMLSPAAADRLAAQDPTKRHDFISAEGAVETQSLQLTAFLMTVCHVVILVQDWFFDPTVVRFIQTAEMLKPSTTVFNADDELVEYYPHLLLVHTKTSPDDYNPGNVSLMQDVYSQTFARSNLQLQSGLGIANGSVINILSPEVCGEPINMFLLPDLDEEDSSLLYHGHPGLTTLIDNLRSQLLSVERNALTHSPLTEKNWFQYASRMWDVIKKNSFFLEYYRLLP
ncbi:nonsense-mediated mRNA decay factor SMG9 isoform X1 [Schistocerca piceifrons]|uniref:nonsense-mediated mRNA decay factor SMG9 isoform X1 n=1 Tax=Schistocerca piceifrons TaxID=274613 RepID=UPI001F5E8A48|nr:nonsense-mediated mRNA decay factor SMG9 isoform X1 [Schistocerca piceifrons]